MKEQELKNWVAINHLYNFKTKDILSFLKFRNDLGALFSLSETQLKEIGIKNKYYKKIKELNWGQIDEEILWGQKENNHIITFLSPEYPEILKHIEDPPPVLYLQGDIKKLSNLQLAIVGSRNPTPRGYENANEFSEFLAQNGFTITSGLALGIDTACHTAALKYNATIAVLGTGLYNTYPSSNKDLARKIAHHGLLVSEFPLATAPHKLNFPRRNRIISGLSLGVLVVEASIYSGSLITARLACEQGREVFAIPGSIHNPLAKGCHVLLRQGAKLVEHAMDIAEELKGYIDKQNSPVNIRQKDTQPNKASLTNTQEDLVLKSIDYEPTTIDLITARSQLNWQNISVILLSLELQGKVKMTNGCYYRV